MHYFEKWLCALALVFSAACSTHNPFENTNNDNRIDGKFVDYKTAGLPGVYSGDSVENTRLELTDNGRVELLRAVAAGASDCQIHVQGELASVREIPSGIHDDGSKEFHFGLFKGSYDAQNTHVLVILPDILQDTGEVFLQILYKGEVVATFDRYNVTGEGPQRNFPGIDPEEALSSEDPEGEALLACRELDVANFYDHNRGIYFQPFEWTGGEVIMDGAVFQRE